MNPHRSTGRRARYAVAALLAGCAIGLTGCGGDATRPQAPGAARGAAPGAAPGAPLGAPRATSALTPASTAGPDGGPLTASTTSGTPDGPLSEPPSTTPTGTGTAAQTGTPTGTTSGGSVAPAAAALPAATRTPGCPAPSRTVVHSAGRRGRTVALTFDDGPSPRTTEQVLAILTRHHVHATFFVVGEHAREHPQLLRAIEAQGSALGNHSWSHPLPHGGGAFDKLPLATQLQEIDRTQDAVVDATGHPPCFFRAPGGLDRSASALTAVRSRGLTLVNWDVDPRDWAAPHHADAASRASILSVATGPAAGGRTQPIVLFHDGAPGVYRGNMLAVLDQVIASYGERGYTFTDPLGHPFG